MVKVEGINRCFPREINPPSDGVRDYNHFGHDFHRTARGVATKSVPIGDDGERPVARVALQLEDFFGDPDYSSLCVGHNPRRRYPRGSRHLAPARVDISTAHRPNSFGATHPWPSTLSLPELQLRAFTQHRLL